MSPQSNSVWNHFKYSEFECPCCRRNKTDDFFIHALDVARDLAGVSFVITSGYRCESHNRYEGGRKNSAHLSGIAADIEIEGECEQNRFKIINALVQVGFKRLGISYDFIHVDDDKNKTQGVLWLY